MYTVKSGLEDVTRANVTKEDSNTETDNKQTAHSFVCALTRADMSREEARAAGLTKVSSRVSTVNYLFYRMGKGKVMR